MIANFTIKNADNILIQAIKHVIKLSSNASYKLEKIEDSGYSDEFANKIKQESEQLDIELKNGTAKRYKSAKDMFEDMGIYEKA